jgi:hypothetical protein
VQIGFWGLLQLLFIGLKLTGLLSWPWSVVLLPAWISLALGFAVAALAVAIEAMNAKGR